MLGLIYVFTALGIASHVLSAPTDHPAQMIIPDSMTAYLELAENVFQRQSVIPCAVINDDALIHRRILSSRPMPLYFAEKLNQYGEIIMTANRSAALQVQFRNFTQWSEKDATVRDSLSSIQCKNPKAKLMGFYFGIDTAVRDYGQ